MSTPYVIKASEGFDIYPEGNMSQDYPWFVQTANSNGRIVADSGVFGGKCLSFNQGAALSPALGYQFPFTGTWQRNNTGQNGKAAFALNGWFRCDQAPTNTTVNNVVTLTSSLNTAQHVPLLGIVNTVANGLQLAFPSSMAGITTTPYALSIQTGQWYWLSLKFVLYPNAQMLASYYVNSIPIQENVPITFGIDPLGTNIANRLMFWGGGVVGQYSFDDLVIQASSGADADWPAGNTGGVPNNPTINTVLTMSPRRIEAQPITANGSVNQWEPSVQGTPNWEAATTSGEFVEAMEAGLVDLYKVTVSAAPLVDCIGVKVVAKTNRYLSVEPAMKDTAGGSVIENPGVVSKGVSTFSTVMEQTEGDLAWNEARIEAAEFGQVSL